MNAGPQSSDEIRIMHDPLTIRDAGPNDAATIVDFNCRLAWETEHKRLDPATIERGVAAALAQPLYARYFLAESVECGVRNAESANDSLHIPNSALRTSSVVGQMMLTYEWSDWRNGMFWWIQSVYVREDARRRGVFRALYRHVEQLARTTPGVCGLRLYVEHENAAAIATYTKLGMVPSGHLLYECDWSGATSAEMMNDK
jgi:ribosomal protein S18 acetylase RimI-like enzyme